MINRILKIFTGKELVFFHPHRNSSPLLNEENKKHYIFINPNILWKSTFVFGANSKMRYSAMSMLISFFSPQYIIDINWITRLHTLYYVWCKRSNKQFIVIQHGAYVGGLITDIPHRIAKCQTFFAWSSYFKSLIESYNAGKKLKCIAFGNPVYNQYDRNTFSYKEDEVKKILVVPSLLFKERLAVVEELLVKLSKFGYIVHVKEHVFQPLKSSTIKAENKVEGNLFEMLKTKTYDIVITDVSSAMADIIFFKNKAIFFSPKGDKDFYTDNLYSKYLKNLALDADKLLSKEFVLQYVSVEAQEKLFTHLAQLGNNSIAQVA